MTGFAANLSQKTLGVLACCVGLLAPSLASAAWLGYKNDTAAPIVVQTSIKVNDKIVRGKQHLLYPGECAWDNIATSGQQQITIMDPKANNKVVGQENINVANQNVLLSLQWQAQPQPPGRPPVPPALRIFPLNIIGPAGVVGPNNQGPNGGPKAGPNAPVPPRTPLPPSSLPPDQPNTPSDTPKPLLPGEQPKTPPPGEQPKGPQEQPKTQPPAGQPKAAPPAQPKAPVQPQPQPPTERPKTPPVQRPPKSKGGV